MTASCTIKIVEIPAGFAGSFAEAIAPYTTLKKSERTRLVSAGEPFELKLEDEAAVEELRKLCTTYGVQIESSRTLLEEDDWSGDDKAIEDAQAAPIITGVLDRATGPGTDGASDTDAGDLSWLDDPPTREVEVDDGARSKSYMAGRDDFAAGKDIDCVIGEGIDPEEWSKGYTDARELAAQNPDIIKQAAAAPVEVIVKEPEKQARKPRAKKGEPAPAKVAQPTEEGADPLPMRKAAQWMLAVEALADSATDDADRRRILLEAFDAETDFNFVEQLESLAAPKLGSAGPFGAEVYDVAQARLKVLLQAELVKGDAPPEVEVIAERQEHSFERELTDDDWRELGKTSAQAARRAADLKAELDRTSKRLKGAIEVAAGEAVDAQNAMLAGKRTITVEVRAELRTDGMVHLVRLDTGEVVERRPLTEQERQRSLFGQAAKTNGVETSDSNDDGWADED